MLIIYWPAYYYYRLCKVCPPPVRKRTKNRNFNISYSAIIFCKYYCNPSTTLKSGFYSHNSVKMSYKTKHIKAKRADWTHNNIARHNIDV